MNTGATEDARSGRRAWPGDSAGISPSPPGPDPPLVAIVGAGRNGSTLLARLLDASPGIWGHPLELNYLAAWDDLARTGAVAALTRQNARTQPLTALGTPLPADVLDAEFGPQWAEIAQTVVARLAERVEPKADPERLLTGRAEWTASDFLPRFLDAGRQAYAPDEAPRTLVFKTIETPYIDDYARLFPAMRFVHILRDPITNYSSLKRTWTHRKELAFYAAGHDILQTFLDARWLPHARALVRVLAADPERHLLVRYEDLVADPAATIGGVCGFLGVESPAEPDRQTTLGGRRLAHGDANPSKPGLEAPERVVPDMASAFGYDEVVTERERGLIARCTAELARTFGYDLGGDERQAALRLWLRWLPPDRSERLHAGSRARWAWAMLRRRAYVTRKLAGTPS